MLRDKEIKRIRDKEIKKLSSSLKLFLVILVLFGLIGGVFN